MSDSTTKENKPLDGGGWLTLVSERYGPQAFGLVAVLTIWYVIMQPQLDSKMTEQETQTQVLNDLRDITRSQEETSRTLERVAQALTATAAILEKTSEGKVNATDSQ